ncbi:MAG TPA: DUF2147 domain-containing protein [Sphingomicrobium sp.]|nr:DUF2147 domain-containing protein [Sphingomicrobium sp.]
MPIVLAFAALIQAAAQDTTQASVLGQWRSPGGNSIIAIAPCGDSLCGTVAWASEKARQASRKTTAQLVGTQLLTGLEQRGPSRWQGKLFIPDKNMRATAKIELVSVGQLKVSGCLAGRALCKSELWTRTTDPLPAIN